MHTYTQEVIPLPPFRSSCPKEFLAKRRKFERKDENIPYIDFLKLYGIQNLEYYEVEDSEDDEEDENADTAGNIDDANGVGDNSENDENDKEMQELEALSSTRLFMKGMLEDEDALEYPDQVDEVAGFAEQPRIREFEKCGALLEDRGAVGRTNDQKVYSQPYFGPLTPHQLREELRKKRFKIKSDKDAPTNMFDDDGRDAEIRQLFVTDLNPSSIEAITATAPRSHAAALKSILYRYLTGKSSIGATISPGFGVYTLEFNIPYFVLKRGVVWFKDPRKRSDGTPLRESFDLAFFSGGLTESTPSKGNYRLYQAQMSVAVTGFDQWVWTAYGFFETYFGSKESVLAYDRLRGPMGGVDPFAAGQIPVHSLISTPREYFFKVLEIRINHVRREWRVIVAKIESEMKISRTENVFTLLSNDAKARKEARDSSLWSSQMIGLLRLLIGGLSDIINAWDEFRRRDMEYFQYDGDVPTQSTLLHSSVSAVDKAFSDLRSLRQNLKDLKDELCEKNPQGLNAHLGFGNHEAAMFQKGSAGTIEAITIITAFFFPLVITTNIFSAQEALPFKPTPTRFVYLHIAITLLVVIPFVLYKWPVWFQPSIEYVVQGLKARITVPQQKKQPDQDTITPVAGVWPAFQIRSARAADLERGPEAGGGVRDG